MWFRGICESRRQNILYEAGRQNMLYEAGRQNILLKQEDRICFLKQEDRICFLKQEDRIYFPELGIQGYISDGIPGRMIWQLIRRQLNNIFGES